MLPTVTMREISLDRLRTARRPLRPGLWRQLGIACREGQVERATGYVLQALERLRQ